MEIPFREEHYKNPRRVEGILRFEFAKDDPGYASRP
jgi:hypothetical protein